jgi:hypothetical protein
MADHATSSAASPEQRTAAVEVVLRRQGVLQDGFVDDFTEHANDAWVTANGAVIVARAWTDPAFRARAVRESRTMLREMGLGLPASTEIRVWDTTADSRYMVLPLQPPATEGWPVDLLAKIVTQDSMIGASQLDEVKG